MIRVIVATAASNSYGVQIYQDSVVDTAEVTYKIVHSFRNLFHRDLTIHWERGVPAFPLVRSPVDKCRFFFTNNL
jgi:hypothetical protein